jgi:hypothetical protein
MAGKERMTLLEEINENRLDFYRKAHQLAFHHYIRWGKVPEKLTTIMEETSSLKAFIEAIRKSNPYHKPAGTPEGGQFDFAPGGSHTSSGRSPKPSARNIYRDFPGPDYAEPRLGNAREVDAAIVTSIMLAMRAPALLAQGAAGIVAHSVRSHLTRMLAPGGKPVGTAGGSRTARELPGGTHAAEKMFKELTKGGKVLTPSDLAGRGGILYKMPDGSHITYRPASRSGPPTIDINVPSLRNIIEKLKFLGGDKP